MASYNQDTDTENNFFRMDGPITDTSALQTDHWEDSIRLDVTDDFSFRDVGPEPPVGTRLLKARAINRGKETTLGATTPTFQMTPGLRENPYT